MFDDCLVYSNTLRNCKIQRYMTNSSGQHSGLITRRVIKADSNSDMPYNYANYTRIILKFAGDRGRETVKYAGIFDQFVQPMKLVDSAISHSPITIVSLISLIKRRYRRRVSHWRQVPLTDVT